MQDKTKTSRRDENCMLCFWHRDKDDCKNLRVSSSTSERQGNGFKIVIYLEDNRKKVSKTIPQRDIIMKELLKLKSEKREKYEL